MNRVLIRQFLLIQAVATFVCLSAEGFCFFVLHLRYPYDCPILVNKGDFFPDFVLLIDRLFVHFHTMAFFAPGDRHFMYPPAATLLYEPFALLPAHRVMTYVALLCLTVVVMASLFAHALRKRGASRKNVILWICGGILLSYPLWFEFQRGNVEMFLWAITSLGIWAFYRGRSYSAAACFGVVGAMKIYPAVFLGLLFARKQYREIAFSVLLALLLSAGCLWLEFPNIRVSLHETVKGLHTFEWTYVQHKFPDIISYDHSLFSLYKRIFQPSLPQLSMATRLYMPLFGLVGLGLFLLHIQRMPFVNQVLTLTVATVLFPPVSFDYTLLYLYLPLCLLLLFFFEEKAPRGVRSAVFVLALLLSPLTEFIHGGHSLEGQIKCVLLVILFVQSLVYPMTSEETPVAGSNARTPGNAEVSEGVMRQITPEPHPADELVSKNHFLLRFQSARRSPKGVPH